MALSPQVIDDAAALCGQFEGFASEPYLDPAGVLTIGFGTTRTPDGNPIGAGTGPIDRTTAARWMRTDLSIRASTIAPWLPLDATPGQQVACLSLAYNIGLSAFRTSTLLKLWQLGQTALAAEQFPKWIWGGGRVLPGLITRRAIERALFEGEPGPDPEVAIVEALNVAELARIRGERT